MIEIAWVPEEMAESELGNDGECGEPSASAEASPSLESGSAEGMDAFWSSISNSKSSSMNPTRRSIFSRLASCLAKRFEAGPFWKLSVMPEPGEGSLIEIMPFRSSDTTACVEGGYEAERSSMSRGTSRSRDSHCAPSRQERSTHTQTLHSTYV